MFRTINNAQCIHSWPDLKPSPRQYFFVRGRTSKLKLITATSATSSFTSGYLQQQQQRLQCTLCSSCPTSQLLLFFSQPAVVRPTSTQYFLWSFEHPKPALTRASTCLLSAAVWILPTENSSVSTNTRWERHTVPLHVSISFYVYWHYSNLKTSPVFSF